jgi:hypothetical protein
MLLRLHRQAEHAAWLDRRASAAAAAAAAAVALEDDEHSDRHHDDDEVSLHGASSVNDDEHESCCSDTSCSSCPSSEGEATDEEAEDLLVKRLVHSAFERRKRKASIAAPPEAFSSSGPPSDGPAAVPRLPSSPPRSSKRQRVAAPAPQAEGEGLLAAHEALLAPPHSAVPCPRAVANDAIKSYHRKHRESARGMSFSLSAPNLKADRVFIHQQAPAASARNFAATTAPQVSPQDHLRAMHERAGLPLVTVPALSRPDLFVAGSQQDYDTTVVQAVRSGDLERIRELAEKEGRDLQCCNKFGESIVHTVARHGAVRVLELLVELGVSVRVCCDSGRTPLSDACWTQAPPKMGMVDLLLDACPDLLYVTDKRGLPPLAYVPREHWEAWRTYLDGRGLARLSPKQPPHRVDP